MHRWDALALATLFAVAGSSCGCTGGYHWETLSRYQPGSNTQTLMTNKPGVYVVGVRQRGDDGLQPVQTTRTYLESGELLGFRTDQNRHVIAYTRRGEFDLGPMPATRVKYLRWTTRQYVEPSNFETTAACVAGEMAHTAVEAMVDGTVDSVLDGRTNSNQVPQSTLRKLHRPGTPQDTAP